MFDNFLFFFYSLEFEYAALCSLLIWYLFVASVSLQSRDRIGTGGPVVDCSRLFDNDLPDGWVCFLWFSLFVFFCFVNVFAKTK